MQHVEFQEVAQLLENWKRLQDDFPEMRRELLEDLGQQMLADIRQRIGGSGTVQSWQGYYIGSKLGYAAVRAKADTYKTTKGGKRYAVGYVTNAIEHGHRNRRPVQTVKKGYRYRERSRSATTPGRHFYQSAQAQIDRMGREELERLSQEIIHRLEG